MIPSNPTQTVQPNYPAVLDEHQTGKWLGFNKREVKALIKAGHLIPLGKNRPRTRKRFAAVDILHLREDLEWLSTGRDLISAYWRKSNARKRKHPLGNNSDIS
jgi:hypothetical protein